MNMRGLVGLAAGFGGGYMQGQDRARRREIEDEQRAYMQEMRERQRQEWAEKDQLKKDMRDAAQPVAVVDGIAKPEYMDNRDVGLPGEVPVGGYMVGGQRYEDRGQAEQVVAPMNSMRAVLNRQAGVQQKAGNIDAAIKYSELADKLGKEGTVKFLENNWAHVPSAEDIRAGKTDFDLTGIEDFNKAGDVRLPAGAKGKASIVKLPNGQEVVDFHVVTPDGKRLPNSARTLERINSMSAAERDKLDRELFESGQKQQNADRDFGHKERTLEETMGWHRDSMAQTAQLQRERMAMDAAQHRASLAVSEANSKRAHGGAGQPTPIWDKDADKTLMEGYELKDPMTGKTSFDGGGFLFAQGVARAYSARHGGNWPAGVAAARQIDERIRAEAGGDPVKLEAGRRAFMARATGQAPPTEPKPAAVAPAGPAAEKPSVMGFIRERLSSAKADAEAKAEGAKTAYEKRLEQKRKALGLSPSEK